MKKILVPTDFSKVTKAALAIATEISRKTHATVELLHIVESTNHHSLNVAGEVAHFEGIEDVYTLKCIELADRQMKAIIHDVNYVGVRFLPIIKVGNLHSHFTRQIADEPSDLIIMGTEGSSSFFKGIFNTSNAEKVVSHATSMVLSVKDIPGNFELRNVLFATSFEEDATEFIVKLKELQDVFDFRLHLLYINSKMNYTKDTSEVVALCKEFVRKHNIENYEFHIADAFTEYIGITDYATNVNADVIAISTHQHHGSHWLGGISEDLVNYAEQPILTFKVK
ncbi:MAG TPA: universal stress protein [Cytophagaceae bacterium]|jgi:nucleotide-binding universal stress UspA family protein